MGYWHEIGQSSFFTGSFEHIVALLLTEAWIPSKTICLQLTRSPFVCARMSLVKRETRCAPWLK